MRKNPLPLLCFLSLLVFWGSGFISIRIGLEGYPPFFFMAGRFLLAGVLLFAFLLAKGTPLPTGRQWAASALEGLLLMVGGAGALAYAQLSIGSGIAAVGIATVPIWVALFSGLLGDWPNRVEWFGIALGFFGVLLLSLRVNL